MMRSVGDGDAQGEFLVVWNIDLVESSRLYIERGQRGLKYL